MYTAQEAYELLEKQVKGREEYTYEFPVITYEGDEGPVEEEIWDCAYSTPDGSPSCIVGHVLRDVMDDEQWAEVLDFEYDSSGQFNRGVSVSGFKPALRLFDSDAINVLQDAQCAQDRGETWGNALLSARAWVES